MMKGDSEEQKEHQVEMLDDNDNNSTQHEEPNDGNHNQNNSMNLEDTNNRNHNSNDNGDDLALPLPRPDDYDDLNFTPIMELPEQIRSSREENNAPVEIENPIWDDNLLSLEEKEGEEKGEEQLPHAYPINIESFIAAPVRILSYNRGDSHPQIIQQTEEERQLQEEKDDDDEPGSTPTSWSLFSFSKKTKLFILTILLLLIIIVGCITVIIKMKERTNSKNPNTTIIIIDNQTFTSEETQNNQTTVEEIMNIDDKEEEQEEEAITFNYTCYTDPMEIQVLEWDLYQQEEKDYYLSQKRTYIICPHTFMQIFGYRPDLLTFDHTTGEVLPLVLFLPNVHVKCGLDGSLSNNCTFFGSYFHILIRDTPIFVDYPLYFIKKENITIEGFRFTQANAGVNIMPPALIASLTIRNCLFDNNSRMFASVRVTAPNVVDNRLTIENCTFVNNTYYHNPLFAATFIGWIPTIGIITAYPLDPYWDTTLVRDHLEDPDAMTVHLTVSNCVFRNNIFLSQSDTIIAAVINLIPPFTSLSVTDSCFVENEGYTSGVISISEGDTLRFQSPEPTTQFYSGNQFIRNMPKEDHKASCILSRQHIYFDDDGLPERSELQDECEEYKDNEEEKRICFT